MGQIFWLTLCEEFSAPQIIENLAVGKGEGRRFYRMGTLLLLQTNLAHLSVHSSLAHLNFFTPMKLGTYL